MMLATDAAALPRRVPPSTRYPGARCPIAELAWLGPIEDEDHILVLGGQGPELMCALLRAGATNVTHLRAHERPEADSANLVIVPRVPSLDWLAAVLPSIRRALTTPGRLVLRAGQAATQTRIRRMLTLFGLTAIHARTTEDGQVLSAALPLRHLA